MIELLAFFRSFLLTHPLHRACPNGTDIRGIYVVSDYSISNWVWDKLRYPKWYGPPKLNGNLLFLIFDPIASPGFSDFEFVDFPLLKLIFWVSQKDSYFAGSKLHQRQAGGLGFLGPKILLSPHSHETSLI